MALNTLTFNVRCDGGTTSVGAPVHLGVVGSGDMEVLMEPRDQGGEVSVQVVTPVTGFDDLWRRVVQSFVTTNNLADLHLEINDNNATPAVVLLRLRQALAEAPAK